MNQKDREEVHAAIGAIAEYTNILYDGRDCPGCNKEFSLVGSVGCYLGDSEGLYPRVAYMMCGPCTDGLEGANISEIHANVHRTIKEWCKSTGRMINRG